MGSTGAPAKRSQHLNATYHNSVGRNIFSARVWPPCYVVLRHVGCWKFEVVRMPERNIVARTWPNDYNIISNIHRFCMTNLTGFKFKPTTPTMSQQFAKAPSSAFNMLRLTMLRYVVLKCCDQTVATSVSAHTFCASRKARFKRHARAGVDIDLINCATKCTTKMNKSSLMSVYLNQEQQNSSMSRTINC